MDGTPVDRYLLTLPFPPSLNAYYLNARRVTKSGKTYNARMISPAGVAFHKEVWRVSRVGHVVPPRFSGRLSILVLARPPKDRKDGRANRSRRDLDNLWKAVLDALTKSMVIMDDALFDDIRMVRGNPMVGGAVYVSISTFRPDEALQAEARVGVLHEDSLLL